VNPSPVLAAPALTPLATASAPASTQCRHCRTPFAPSPREEEFCCPGCRAVYHWIHEQSLDLYYALKGEQSTPAVGSLPFDPRDWTWARELQTQSESQASDGSASAELTLRNLSCAACVWLIEKRFEDQPGHLSAGIFPAEGRLAVTWEPGVFDLPAFLEDLLRFGYEAQLLGEAPRTRQLGLPLGICSALWLNTMAFTLPRYFGMPRESETGMLCDLIAFASASLAVLAGGSYFFVRAWRALRSRVLHIDLPIAIGVAAAYAGAIWGWVTGNEALFYHDFVATFLFLMLTGRWVQEQAVARAQHRTHEDQFIPAPHRVLVSGEIYELAPGGIVPVESRLLDVGTTYSLEWITGEPDPVTAAPLAVLPAGARLLGSQVQRLEARERFEDGLLAKLLGARESGIDRLLQRVLGIYLAVVLLLAAAGGIAWSVFGTGAQALQVVISVLVVSCPCGLGVSLPLLNARCSRHLESFGLVLRNLSLWSRIGKVRQLVFDKTGTLTLPNPRLLNPEALEALDAESRDRLRDLVRRNRHPFARSLDEAMATCGTAESEAEITETPGAGVSLADEAGRRWSLGKSGFASLGTGDLLFSVDQTLLATFRFEEAVRPDAAEELLRLRSFTPQISILSGDRPERVRAIAHQIGLAEKDAHGGMSPQGKADWLREHRALPALFIGDGANDSLAVDEAFCSGTPVTGPSILEPKADFHFFGRGLQAIRVLFETERKRRGILRRIFTFAIAYNLTAICVCLMGHMSPLVAAVIMPLSSLVSIGTASSNFGRR